MANVLSKKFDEKSILYWRQHECGELCPHVENGEKGYVVYCETDSFGPLIRYVACKACYDESEEEWKNETFVCRDCKETKKNSLRVEWTWYDFYAPQGDEPYVLCRPCTALPRHRSRVASDNEDYKEEFPHHFGD